MTDKRKTERPLYLDMPFGEALERFAKVKPSEVKANEDKKKRKRAPDEGKSPDAQGHNVVDLRRKRKRNHI